jgi:hypothetical protein
MPFQTSVDNSESGCDRFFSGLHVGRDQVRSVLTKYSAIVAE